MIVAFINFDIAAFIGRQEPCYELEHTQNRLSQQQNLSVLTHRFNTDTSIIAALKDYSVQHPKPHAGSIKACTLQAYAWLHTKLSFIERNKCYISRPVYGWWGKAKGWAWLTQFFLISIECLAYKMHYVKHALEFLTVCRLCISNCLRYRIIKKREVGRQSKFRWQAVSSQTTNFEISTTLKLQGCITVRQSVQQSATKRVATHNLSSIIFFSSS